MLGLIYRFIAGISSHSEDHRENATRSGKQSEIGPSLFCNQSNFIFVLFYFYFYFLLFIFYVFSGSVQGRGRGVGTGEPRLVCMLAEGWDGKIIQTTPCS